MLKLTPPFIHRATYVYERIKRDKNLIGCNFFKYLFNYIKLASILILQIDKHDNFSYFSFNLVSYARFSGYYFQLCLVMETNKIAQDKINYFVK